MKVMKRYAVIAVFLAFIFSISVMMLLLPKSIFSENEKRALAQFPEISLDSVLSGEFGKEFETYLADHFPMRDLFFGINAYTQLYTGRNGLSGIYAADDGYLIPTPATLDRDRAARNIKRLAQFAENAGIQATLIAVPNPGYILEDKLPANHLEYMDSAVFEHLDSYRGKLQIVDLRPAFFGSDQQIYYRTDHHLTSAGTYEMYKAFCDTIGVVSEEFSSSEVSEGFYGTGYSKSGLWLTEPDSLEIWGCNNASDFTVTIVDGKREQTFESLYFTEHLEKMDQYPVFLDGNHELTVIENHSVSNGKRLLLIKDSYAHCFATFAAEDYEMICMVDLRYFRQKTSDLITKYGLTEILYLYGVENLAGSTDIAWLE